MSADDWARILAIIPSIVLHEVSHGWVANAFGDDTAKRAGRLTLNPIAHVDPFGTLILPVLLALTSFGAFGYAKPVPVNPGKLRNPRQHSLYVGLAGPAVNIGLAVLAALWLKYGYDSSISDPDRLTVPLFLFWFGFVNVVLAVFNLLPIPPLDGSAVVERLLPTRWWPTWLRFRQWGFGIVLLVVLVIPGALNGIFEPALDQWVKLL